MSVAMSVPVVKMHHMLMGVSYVSFIGHMLQTPTRGFIFAVALFK